MVPPIFTDEYIRRMCPETRPLPMKSYEAFAVTEPAYKKKGLIGIKYVAPPVKPPPTMQVYARALSGHRNGIKREQAEQANIERVRQVVMGRVGRTEYDPRKDYASDDPEWENSEEEEEKHGEEFGVEESKGGDGTETEEEEAEEEEEESEDEAPPVTPARSGGAVAVPSSTSTSTPVTPMTMERGGAVGGDTPIAGRTRSNVSQTGTPLVSPAAMAARQSVAADAVRAARVQAEQDDRRHRERLFKKVN